MYCCIYAPGNLPVLLDCARRFSPLIEEHRDMVVFDIRGLDSLYGPPTSIARAAEREVGLPAQIAVAANPDATVHAARGFKGITVIAPGQEAETLGPLPLNLLGGSEDVALSLDLWGIRTFGAFAALPPLGVAARLGDEGAALQRLARGQGYRRLRIVDESLTFDAAMELESPIELLDSLCFVLNQLLNDVLGRLTRSALATNELRLTLTLERAADYVLTLRFPLPMTDAKTLLKVLHLELSEDPPPQAVVKVHLHAEPVNPRRTQEGLFASSSPEAEKLETTLARVRHLVGKENVGSPFRLDTHRPDSFALRPFAPPRITQETGKRMPKLCLRRFRPPRLAQVLLTNHRPTHLNASVAKGQVATARGPWRSSGNWWSDDGWDRDCWDIALHTGVLFRIFRDIASGLWFIEGSYD